MAVSLPSDLPISEKARPDRGERIFIGNVLILMAVAVAVAVLLLDVSQVPPEAPISHGQGTGGAEATHSDDVLGLAVEGVGAVAIGVALISPGLARSRRVLGLAFASVLLYVDGMIHWLAVAEHLAEFPSAAFFMATGAVQIGAVPLVLRRERALWFVGVLFTVLLVQLFLATRFVPPPFATEPESFEFLGSLSKIVEFAILGALALVFGREIVPRRLGDSLTKDPPVVLLVAGAVATEVTAGIEALWGLLSLTVFWIASALLIAFMGSAALAYRRESRIWSGIAWSLSALLILGHLLYALYYGTLALAAPVVFCAVSGVLLAAPFVRSARQGLSTWTRGPAAG
ncbi:MAG: hypothetical protein HY724_09770 [Candidatus Rokubacteria bacterium]|nr:hypothetical protein [Candidatus Rokubacteria bacterium]